MGTSNSSACSSRYRPSPTLGQATTAPCPRARFDDGIEADWLRARRRIVKGRFWGGSIGYVLAEDLALYANVFRQSIPWLNEIQSTVWEAVQATGPLTRVNSKRRQACSTSKSCLPCTGFSEPSWFMKIRRIATGSAVGTTLPANGRTFS